MSNQSDIHMHYAMTVAFLFLLVKLNVDNKKINIQSDYIEAALLSLTENWNMLTMKKIVEL